MADLVLGQQLSFPFDKRWQNREERWLPPEGRDLFRPGEFSVDIIDTLKAKTLVEQHHYSRSFPASRLSVGLFQNAGAGVSQLVGVAVFSVPMQAATVPRYTGLEGWQGVELGRFLCLPSVAFNGETWFLARAFSLLRSEKADVEGVVSYADPMERRSQCGLLTKPAHAGQIYQASNATFAGRAAARWVWLDRQGQVVSERALAKIKAQHAGHGYAERQLLAAGADARRRGEEPRDWLSRVLVEPVFRRVRHPGNYAFVFGLTRQATATIRRIAGGTVPYPRLRPPSA